MYETHTCNSCISRVRRNYSILNSSQTLPPQYQGLCEPPHDLYV
jgi:hypothetical protein